MAGRVRVTVNKRALAEFMRGTRGRSVGAKMAEAAQLIKEEAANRAPEDTGALKASMRVRKENVGTYGVKYEIIADTPYSGYANQGTGPQAVDPYGRPAGHTAYVNRPGRGSALAMWGMRHGFQYFIIAELVAEKGTKPTLYMKESFELAARRYPQLFGRRSR